MVNLDEPLIFTSPKFSAGRANRGVASGVSRISQWGLKLPPPFPSPLFPLPFLPVLPVPFPPSLSHALNPDRRQRSHRGVGEPG